MYLIGTAEYYEENPVEDSIVQGFSEEQKALYDEYVYGDATMLIESNRLEGIGSIKQLQWNWWEQIFWIAYRDGECHFCPCVPSGD